MKLKKKDIKNLEELDNMELSNFKNLILLFIKIRFFIFI